MEFPYGAQPNMAAQQQHHPTPVQPPMSVSQQPPNGPPSQQQTPTQPAAQPPNARSRKRPAQNAAPSPATAAAPPPVAAAQGQPPAPTPPAPQAAPPSQAQPTANDDANSANAASGPPTKKSRTNTPWTPQEELRLKQMRDAGNSWAEIAKVCSKFLTTMETTSPFVISCLAIVLGFTRRRRRKLIEMHTDLPYAHRRISEEALVQGHALC